jgi:hypothetical protein
VISQQKLLRKEEISLSCVTFWRSITSGGVGLILLLNSQLEEKDACIKSLKSKESQSAQEISVSRIYPF